MLPGKTQASFRKGIWFVHDDGVNVIKIVCSVFGNEKVYLNEKLVSQRRSLKMVSEHKFKDDNENVYGVKFIVLNLSKGSMECQVVKNGEVIKSFHAAYKKAKIPSLAWFLLLIIISAAVGVIIVKFKLPVYSIGIFVGIVLVFQFYTIGIGKIVIEDKQANN